MISISVKTQLKTATADVLYKDMQFGSVQYHKRRGWRWYGAECFSIAMRHNSRHKSPSPVVKPTEEGNEDAWDDNVAEPEHAEVGPKHTALQEVHRKGHCEVYICVCVCVKEHERCHITQLAPHKQQKSKHLAHHDTAGLWRERPPPCRTLLVQGHGNLSNWVHCTHAIHNTSEIK